MTWMRWVSSAGLAGLLAACSSNSGGHGQGRVEAEIQGGQADPKNTFVVGICETENGSCAAICTGALIAPNLVLTARHCIEDSDEEIDCATARFGGRQTAPARLLVTTNADMFRAHEEAWYSVSRVVAPSDRAFCGNDIALLVLTRNVPLAEASPITPAVQYPITDHKRFSTTQIAIGYGQTGPSDDGSGERRIREQIPIACIPGDPVVDCGELKDANLSEREYVAGDGTCQGDSGSSAIEQLSYNAGKPVSLGVLSRGGVSLDGTRCQGAVYTRVDSWKDLIVATAKQAAQSGRYAPPSWVAPPPVEPGPKPGPNEPAGPAAEEPTEPNPMDPEADEPCSGGSCVEPVPTPNGGNVTTTVTKTGCSMGPSGRSSWALTLLAALACGAGLRRRRRR